jgi:hypothetical protein
LEDEPSNRPIYAAAASGLRFSRGREALRIWGWSLLPPAMALAMFVATMSRSTLEVRWILAAMAGMDFLIALPVLLLLAFLATLVPGGYSRRRAGMTGFTFLVVAVLAVILSPKPLTPAQVAERHAALQNSMRQFNDRERADTAAKKAAREKEVAAIKARAETGDATAELEVARLYMGGKDLPADNAQAASWLRKSAAQDNAAAQAALGALYEGGLGVPQDYALADAWFEKAARRGDADAAFGLSWLYSKGLGVKRDPTAALSWLETAARRGKPEAQFAFGGFCERGAPPAVAQDDVQAYKWYVLAGDGNLLAAEARDRLAERLTPEQIAEARRLAAAWKPSR